MSKQKGHLDGTASVEVLNDAELSEESLEQVAGGNEELNELLSDAVELCRDTKDAVISLFN